MSNILIAKEQASLLKEKLLIMGVEIKLSQAYECVAAINKQPDWNRYRAKLVGGDNADLIPVESKESTPAKRHCPEDQPISIIALPIGSGRTSMLFGYCEETIRKGDNAIFINCVDTNNHRDIPSSILDQACIIELSLDDVLSKDYPKQMADQNLIGSKRFLFINISRDLLNAIEHSSQISEASLIKVTLVTIKSMLTHDFIEKVGCLVIDDFDYLKIEYCDYKINLQRILANLCGRKENTRTPRIVAAIQRKHFDSDEIYLYYGMGLITISSAFGPMAISSGNIIYVDQNDIDISGYFNRGNNFIIGIALIAYIIVKDRHSRKMRDIISKSDLEKLNMNALKDVLRFTAQIDKMVNR